MSYKDIGFDENLMRIDQSVDNTSQQYDPTQFDYATDQISGSKIQGGLMASSDGKSQFDLENGTFKVKNGVSDVVTLGVLDDGSIGLVIKDNQGNELMHVSADTFFMQSANNILTLDFITDQMIVREDSGLPRVVVGKLP